jgi:hypothetical protein
MAAEQEHPQEIARLYHLLAHTERLTRDAAVLGMYQEGGTQRCRAQFNKILARLIALGAVPEDLFDPLGDDASNGEIGVACSYLVAFLSREYPDLAKDSPQDPSAEMRLRQEIGETVRQSIRLAAPPIGKFSEGFKRTMVHAREEAERLHNDYIGSEHLLLALLRQSDEPASRLDVDLEALRRAIEEACPAQTGTLKIGQIPFTPRAKQALEVAAQEAQGMTAPQVGTLHLLLALLRENQGTPREVLNRFGVTYESVKGRW